MSSMIRVSILVDKKEKLCDNFKKLVKDFIFQNSVEEVQINKQMADKYLNTILELLNGEEFEGTISLKNDVVYGNLRMIIKEHKNPIDINILDRTCKRTDITELNSILSETYPKYLIMTYNTLSILSGALLVYDPLIDDDQIYRGVPIAITKSLDPGIIDIVM